MNFDKDYSPKHIQNLSRDEAHINLFSDIGGDGINGQSFADEIQMLNQIEVKTINIHINSGGGSVIDGFSIFSAINNSDAHVNVFIEGIAASMAGVIAMAGDKIHMTDFSKIMIHNPHNGGQGEEDENVMNALSAMRDSLLTILNNKASITEAKMSKIMNEETWISPKEALEMGLIDEIVKTKKVKAQTKAAITGILNSYSNNNNNDKNDMKNIAKHLNLNEDATEAAILAAIKTIESSSEKATKELGEAKDELTESKAKVKELTDKVGEFEASAEEIEATIVEETIDKAIEDGTFAKEDKESLVEDYAGNSKGLKSIMSKIKVGGKAVTVIDKLKGSAPKKGESKLPEQFKGKSYKELFRSGDIEKVRNENEAEFFALYKTEHSVDHPDFIEA